MAAYAMYARDAAYSAVKMAEEENDRGVQATNGGTNTPRQRGKQRKWKPLHLDTDAQATDNTIQDNIWGEGFPSPTHLPASHLSNNKQFVPKVSQPSKRKQNRRKKMALIEVKSSAYIPPYLRRRGYNASGTDLYSAGHPKALETDLASPVQEGDPAVSTVPTKAPDTGNARPKSPPSPPASIIVPKMAQQPQNFQPRWPKTGPKKHVWPKNKDMRAKTSGSGSDGGVSFKSNSQNDPDYDIKKLVDWDGNWMPAPVEWAGRKSFTDRHFAQHIENWAIQIDNAYGGEDHGRIPLETSVQLEIFTGSPNGQAVPRSWIPMQIEGEPPHQFWRTFPNRAPAPLSDVDLDEVRPFWEAYPDDQCLLLSPISVPEAFVDPSDYYNRLPGVIVSAKQLIKRKKDAHEERVRRANIRRFGPVNDSTSIPTPVPDTSLKPRANIYIRPVVPADMTQITSIYNHYIKESIKANEFNERTQSQMSSRVNDITGNGLPWIVAVLKGNHRPHQEQGYVTEHIVGFSYIDDYCDPGSMYRFTFELEMYVHPEHLRQGIGKCMLDQMLEMVDTGYKKKGGYDWTVQGDYLRHGCARRVKSLNLGVLHENGKTEEIDWVSKLLRDFGFRRGGHLHQIGFKLGKSVDLSTFQHITSETIEADHRPTVPL